MIGFRNMFDGTSDGGERTFNVLDRTFVIATDGRIPYRWFDALTARLGYSWPPNWLLYFQGGGVWSSCRGKPSCDRYRPPAPVFFAGSASTTKTGWTIGGGWEYEFSPNWSVFIEGNYYDFGGRDRTIFSTGAATACLAGCAFHTKTTAATALVGVNYKLRGFGTGL